MADVCTVLQTFVFWGFSLESGKDPKKGGIRYVGVWHYTLSTYTIQQISCEIVLAKINNSSTYNYIERQDTASQRPGAD